MVHLGCGGTRPFSQAGENTREAKGRGGGGGAWGWGGLFSIITSPCGHSQYRYESNSGQDFIGLEDIMRSTNSDKTWKENRKCRPPHGFE